MVEAWKQNKEEACTKAGINLEQTGSDPGSPSGSLSLKQVTDSAQRQ